MMTTMTTTVTNTRLEREKVTETNPRRKEGTRE